MEALVTPVHRGYTQDLAIRLDTDYNQLMREVARSESTPIADAGALLDGHPSDYLDLNHLNARGHQRVAEAIAPTLRRMVEQSGPPRCRETP
jgi:lysophospholipase L1-like esterase